MPVDCTAEARERLVGVVIDDAAVTCRHAGMVPASLVLGCGLFPNIVDEDTERTVACRRSLCQRGGTVVWTHHRRPPAWCRSSRWFECAHRKQPGPCPSAMIFDMRGAYH
jgi:hypothetical protein